MHSQLFHVTHQFKNLAVLYNVMDKRIRALKSGVNSTKNYEPFIYSVCIWRPYSGSFTVGSDRKWMRIELKTRKALTHFLIRAANSNNFTVPERWKFKVSVLLSTHRKCCRLNNLSIHPSFHCGRKKEERLTQRIF